MKKMQVQRKQQITKVLQFEAEGSKLRAVHIWNKVHVMLGYTSCGHGQV